MSAINRYGYGKRSGPALVFVHGAGMDSTIWTNQARYFAARGRNAIGVDLPGHGPNDESLCGSIEDMARWLDEMLADEADDEVTLIGHSMGAFVGLETAHLRPSARLILVGAAASMPVHPALLDAAQNDLLAAAAMMADWGLAGGAQNRVQALPSTSTSWSARRLVERSRPGVLASDLKACAAYQAAEARFGQANIVSMIAGGRDRMTPMAGTRELIGERVDLLTVIKPVGHMLPIEAPAELRRCIAKLV